MAVYSEQVCGTVNCISYMRLCFVHGSKLVLLRAKIRNCTTDKHASFIIIIIINECCALKNKKTGLKKIMSSL